MHLVFCYNQLFNISTIVKYMMVLFYLAIFISIGGLLLFLLKESAKPGIFKNIRRWVNTGKNIRKGIVSSKEIKWCTLPYTVERGLLDITHPSLYWDCIKNILYLAATPYPQSLGHGGLEYENPYLFYAPFDGGEAPVDFICYKDEPVCLPEEAKYNSDPVLFKDEERLFLLTRKVEGPDYFCKIVIQELVDGNWSNPIDLLKTDRICASPMIIKKDGIYRIYLINTRYNTIFGKKSIGYYTENLECWSSHTLAPYSFSFVNKIEWKYKQQIYHSDLIHHQGYFYLIFNALHTDFRTFYGIRDHFKYLWICRTRDFINFEMCPKPLLKRAGIYKPSGLFLKDKLIIYFSTDNSYYGKARNLYKSGNRIGVIEVSVNYLYFE